jgi:DNA-binding NarL/FixJ family response regulator
MGREPGPSVDAPTGDVALSSWPMDPGGEPEEPRLGVVLVESLALVRAGLRLLVSDQPDMEIVVEAGTSAEALDALRKLRRRSRTIVVLSLGLQSGEAFRLIREVRATYPTMPVLASELNPDGEAVSRALFAGADGFVNPDVQPGEFIDALRRAAAGDVVLAGVPADWLPTIAGGLERRREAPGQLLTQREVQVLAVAAEGLTARQIGTRLGLRERTVTTHLGRIYSKLGVSSRTAAVTAAARSGLVALAGVR